MQFQKHVNINHIIGNSLIICNFHAHQQIQKYLYIVNVLLLPLAQLKTRIKANHVDMNPIIYQKIYSLILHQNHAKILI